MKKSAEGKYVLSMDFEGFNQLEEDLISAEVNNQKAETLLEDIISGHFEDDANWIMEKWQRNDGESRTMVALMIYNYGKVQTFLNIVGDYLLKNRKQIDLISKSIFGECGAKETD